MNDNHQKIYNQYRDIMREVQEAKKCGDREKSIRLCDKLLFCANKMPSPEKEDMLTKGFIFRGRLNYMRSDYERADEDFSKALTHNPHNSTALRYQALTELVKGPCLKKGYPYHQDIIQRWFNIVNMQNAEKNNPAHFSHKFIQMWKNLFRNTGFFPSITMLNLWQDFAAKFPILYHTVPDEYECSFAQQGRLFFRTLTDLRAIDSKEGAFDVKFPEWTGTFKTESFVFCLSLSPEIAKVTGKRVVYKIATERLMQNFMHSIEFIRENLEISDVRYFAGHAGHNRPYKDKKMMFHVSAGAVYYGEQVPPSLSTFIKNPYYFTQNEVRIDVAILTDEIDPVTSKRSLLTVGSDLPGFIIKVPNPAEWCRKI